MRTITSLTLIEMELISSFLSLGTESEKSEWLRPKLAKLAIPTEQTETVFVDFPTPKSNIFFRPTDFFPNISIKLLSLSL